MSEDAAKFVGLDQQREMHVRVLRSEASEPLCETQVHKDYQEANPYAHNFTASPLGTLQAGTDSVRAGTASAAQAIHDVESPGRFSGYEDLGKVKPGTLSQMPSDQLVIRKAQDGGFVVIDSGAGIKGVPFLFAAGTIQEICEYLEDKFGG